jgi:hypothetical protein
LTAPRLGFGPDDEIRKFHPVRLLHQGVRVEPLILQLAGDRLLEPTEYLARSPDMSSGPEPGAFRRPWPIGSFRFNCEDGKKAYHRAERQAPSRAENRKAAPRPLDMGNGVRLFGSEPPQRSARAYLS